ncbi:33 kDa inner dynein arm light chain, axonemal-like [Argiope bruennichi]|uniref:33 kDa inner dynein arm light chain, axonemal-like n=1 Tax=Argiope bruennichi TaxID=94029 RepID=UPI0024941F35|nr:33 kDa inner dynein arm light chain, axonemal-like [Argiope bruennichi]
MTENNEPDFVKYEEVLLPDEPVPESRPGTSKEDSDSSTESDEEEDKEIPMETGDVEGGLDDPERAEAVRRETIERILDYTFIPRKIEKNGKMYLQRLSRQPVSREDVIEVSKKFENCLREREVKMSGFCPLRRELYDLLFTLGQTVWPMKD